MVKYYTLEEAAQILRMTPTKLRELAKTRGLRVFPDRGTLHFRATEVDELAREMGFGSDPDLPLGEAGMANEPPSSPSSGPPKSASDSDVRLVSGDDDDLDFSISLDSDVPLGEEMDVGGSPAESSVRLVPGDEPSDSDVQIIPDAEDVDVLGDQPKGPRAPSDSDIRLEEADKRGSDGGIVTEDIDLDAEDKAAGRDEPRKRPRPSSPQLPTGSPFELSEADLDVGAPPEEAGVDSSSDFELNLDDSSPLEPGSDEQPALVDDEEVTLGELSDSERESGINLQDPADSGISLEQGGSDELDDFELGLEEKEATPGPSDTDSSSDFELSLDADDAMATADDSSSEFELSLDADDDDALVTSADDSSSEFELSLDADDDDALATADDSSSEFELSLDADDAEATAADDESSSEFELSLDADDDSSSDFELEQLGEESDSDSEFELTLDGAGDLEMVGDAEEEGDIFETDLDVPALEEESGSEAVALEDEGDLAETSDFELDMDEEEQVVDVDEEEDADTQAATLHRKRPRRRPVVEDDEEDFDDLEAEVELEEEEEEDRRREPVMVEAPPAEWGPLPAIVLFPTVIILFVVGLMSFELIQGMWGYKRSGTVSRLIVDKIARSMQPDLPK